MAVMGAGRLRRRAAWAALAVAGIAAGQAVAQQHDPLADLRISASQLAVDASPGSRCRMYTHPDGSGTGGCGDFAYPLELKGRLPLRAGKLIAFDFGAPVEPRRRAPRLRRLEGAGRAAARRRGAGAAVARHPAGGNAPGRSAAQRARVLRPAGQPVRRPALGGRPHGPVPAAHDGTRADPAADRADRCRPRRWRSSGAGCAGASTAARSSPTAGRWPRASLPR